MWNSGSTSPYYTLYLPSTLNVEFIKLSQAKAVSATLVLGAAIDNLGCIHLNTALHAVPNDNVDKIAKSIYKQ